MELLTKLEENFEKAGVRSKNGLAVDLLSAAMELLLSPVGRPVLPFRLREMREKLHGKDPYAGTSFAIPEVASVVAELPPEVREDREKLLAEIKLLRAGLEIEQLKRELAEEKLRNATRPSP